MDPSVFGGLSRLSISSLASDDDQQSGLNLNDSEETNIYQRLQDLEEMTNNFLTDKPILLSNINSNSSNSNSSNNCSANIYTDIEAGSIQTFEIRLQSIGPSEVFVLTVDCLPEYLNYNNDDMEYNYCQSSSSSRPAITHHPLDIALRRKRISSSIVAQPQQRKHNNYPDDATNTNTITNTNTNTNGIAANTAAAVPKDVIFRPSLHNGEYSFILTTAHGLTAGAYTMTVQFSAKTIPSSSSSSSSSTQPVKVGYKVYPSARSAMPLEANKLVIGKVSGNDIAYYRFVLTDPKKLLTIRVRPIVPSQNQQNHEHHDDPTTFTQQYINTNTNTNQANSSDPDLYVTNCFEGLVGVTKDMYTWRGTQVGADRIDIHPSDPKASRGGIFMIGVLGNRDKNDFELSVTVSDPPYIQTINVEEDGDVDFELGQDQYSYYCMRIDPKVKGPIVLNISPVGASKSNLNSSSNDAAIASKLTSQKYEINRTYGRSVYTSDTLSSSGLLGSAITSIANKNKNKNNMSMGATKSKSMDASNFTSSNTNIPSTPKSTNKLSSSSSSSSSSYHAAASLSTPSQNKFSHSHSIGNFTPNVAVGTSFNEISLHESKVQNSCLIEAIPDSLALFRRLFPVAFISADCMYPSAQDYTWRASSIDGNVVIIIEPEEWKYFSGMCYFSLYGLDVHQQLDPFSKSSSSSMLSSIKTKKMSPLHRHHHHHNLERTNDAINSSLAPSSPSPTNIFAHDDSLVDNDKNYEHDNETFDKSQKSNLICRINVKILSATDTNGPVSTHHSVSNKVFEKVFQFVDGNIISQRERSSKGTDDQALTYGEIDFSSFISMIHAAGTSDGLVFYDLGCGIGKSIVAAALSGIRFIKCVGIEILSTLCLAGGEALDKTRELLEDGDGLFDMDQVGGNGNGEATQHDKQLEQRWVLKSLHASLPLMEIREDNILTADWNDADLVFISCMCFPDDMMRELLKKSASLKPGCKVISLKLMDGYEQYFSLEQSQWFNMSWGRVLAHFLVRNNHNDLM